MTRFHPLEVTDVKRETRDAVVVTLKPRGEDQSLFDFIQGQYLTFRRDFDGTELRRSYSICAGRDDGVLQVGIKRVDGGAFSTWANENLKKGDVIEAMPPMGTFHTLKSIIWVLLAALAFRPSCRSSRLFWRVSLSRVSPSSMPIGKFLRSCSAKSWKM